MEKTGGAVLTTDSPIGHDVRAEAEAVLRCLRDGGVAIIPLNVAYGIVGHTESAIRRIFHAKKRSFEKPSGCFGNLELSRDLHVLDARGEEVRRALIEEADLPFSIVAPFRRDHPFLAPVDPFVIQTSSKNDGTMDMLMNAGPLHDALVDLSRSEGVPVFGSSANKSLTGSKFTLEDVEPELRAAADIMIDHGPCRDRNADGVSSTILDFRDFSVLRRGCRFDELTAFLKARLDIAVK
jgi:tRNA A37 threonylcarbamoyladenosine synthetase subunit TsaC/SUA5/YrdC